MCHAVFCSEYVQGWGVRTWDPTNERHMQMALGNVAACDMYATFGPMADTTDTNLRTNWRCMLGTVPTSLNATEDLSVLMSYPGATAVARHWSLHHISTGRNNTFNTGLISTSSARDELPTAAGQRGFAPIAFQEVQFRWSPATKAFTHCTEDRGHWGRNIGPGLAKVVNQHMSRMDTPSYIETKVMTLV